MNPDEEWREDNHIAERIARWTRERGRSSRLYPAALVWCCRKPGRDLQDRVELWLAWQKIKSEIDAGNLGPEFERSELNTVAQQIRNSEQEAIEEAHASYRFISLGDFQAESGLKTIDMGAGHSGSTETPSGRVVNALRSEALLNESVGASYIDRNWPPALQESGAWPLSSLRQSFLNGSLTRLLDPDRVLQQKILEFVEKGDFGLASGEAGQGSYIRSLYRRIIPADEVTFNPDTFLITKSRAEQMLAPPKTEPEPEQKRDPETSPDPRPTPDGNGQQQPPTTPQETTLRLRGTVPPESWNMVGRRIVTRLQQGHQLKIEVAFTSEVEPVLLPSLKADIQQALEDLKLDEQVRISRT